MASTRSDTKIIVVGAVVFLGVVVVLITGVRWLVHLVL